MSKLGQDKGDPRAIRMKTGEASRGTEEAAPGNARVTMDGLVRDLLRLDPEVLAKMSAGPSDPGCARLQGTVCRAGLNAFMKKVLTLHLALEDDKAAAVRLKTERTARANGWPDARTANVGMLFAWALLDHNRWLKGLPSVPLLNPRPAGGRRPEPLDPAPAGQSTVRELVSKVRQPCELADAATRRDRSETEGARESGAASGNALIRELLGLDPEVLSVRFDWKVAEAGTTYAKDPEAAGRGGLNALLRDALRQYGVMLDEGVDRVRLMSELDAKEGRRPDARSANFATLLSCGLMCEDDREVAILPPRPYSRDREDLLRAVAKHAYLNPSDRSFRALDLLCDDDVHFGAWDGLSKGHRLFQQAGAEHDPEGTRTSGMSAAMAVLALWPASAIEEPA